MTIKSEDVDGGSSETVGEFINDVLHLIDKHGLSEIQGFAAIMYAGERFADMAGIGFDAYLGEVARIRAAYPSSPKVAFGSADDGN